ncbi:MAG: hypothetical protein B7X95_09620 [Methylophilaceae bacterium 17-44-8]|jgi:hypothetical protein|nr:MAG: hypothetical protein B7X95_09620 [Methylophilaceae bacterium 17-44-8]
MALNKTPINTPKSNRKNQLGGTSSGSSLKGSPDLNKLNKQKTKVKKTLLPKSEHSVAMSKPLTLVKNFILKP